jgi:hypothetical protein
MCRGCTKWNSEVLHTKTDDYSTHSSFKYILRNLEHVASNTNHRPGAEMFMLQQVVLTHEKLPRDGQYCLKHVGDFLNVI